MIISRAMKLIRTLMLCLSVQGLSLSAQMYIFPTAYGPSDKYQVVDTARYEITYQINAKLNPNPKYSFVAYEDVQTLLIGKNVSATYSQDILKVREVADEEMRKGAQTVEDFSDITFPEDVFEATGISRPQKVLPIVKYKEEYKRTERRKVRELCRRMHADLARTLKASFPRARFHGLSTFYYNPIELE